MRQTLTQDTASYFRQIARWADPARAAISGYAAALFAWEVTHPAALSAFVLKNDLPLDARRGLAWLLVGGIMAALLFWLATGWGVARIRAKSLEWGLTRSARLLFVAAPLPFLPLLGIPGLEREHPFLTFGLVAAAAALVIVVVRGLLAPPPTADGRPQRSTFNVQRSTSGSRRSSVGGLRSAVITHQPPARNRQRSTFNVQRSTFNFGRSAVGGLLITLLLAGGYALFMSILTVARHNSFMTHAFDLGIHDQAVYNILHGGVMRTTLYGPYAIDYIGDHFSPILFLLAPIYALYQDARTLLVLQSLFLAAGALPLYLLTQRKTRSALLGVALAASYLLYPALHGVNLKDFHQIALVCALLLAALYFLEIDRIRPFLIALGLALIVKEEVALTVAAIGAYIFLAKRRYRLGAGVMIAGLAYFAVVVGWVMPLLGGTPQIDTRFGGYIAAGTQGATGIAWTLFTNPIFTAIWILGTPGKLIFLFQLFLPVLFLPVLAPGLAWLPALPSLAILLLTSAHTQYDITYHYSAHLIPFVFFLTVQALAQLVLQPQRDATRTRMDADERGEDRGSAALGRARPRPIVGALAASLLIASLAMSYQFGQIISKHGVEIPAADRHDAIVASFVAQIPRDAPVSAMSDIVTHLTARRTAYLFPDMADATYLLLDTDPRANYWPHEGLKARERAIRDMIPHVRSGEFGLVRMEDGVLLLQRGADTSRNDEALAGLLTTRYEAEELKSDFERSAKRDPQASGGQAREATPAAVRPDGKAALVFGPYTDLPQGKYRVEYVMRFDRSDLAERVATVDVFTFRDGYPRATRDVVGTEFTAPDPYQPFALEFESDKPLEDLEFRVQYAGQGVLGLDYVRVTPIEIWLP
jgi:uncharacterized membrane protein